MDSQNYNIILQSFHFFFFFYHLQLSKQVLTKSCNIFSPDGGIWKGYWDLWTGLHFDKYLTVYQQFGNYVHQKFSLGLINQIVQFEN